MLRTLRYGAWILGLTIIFSGCFGKVPQMQYYELEALGDKSGFQTKARNMQSMDSNKNLKMRTISWEINVAQKIASKKIAYKNNTNSIAYFSKNAWIEPFSVMLDSLAQKIAINYGICNDTSTEHLKINVLDCYFDTQRESVFVRLLVESKKGSAFVVKEELVESGGFIKIIEGFERALNTAFLEVFRKF
ncbi:hypothetical protein [Helicobacter turcicus]|uniref:ABC-type transport auxiliary lipoprotein component domain-containing protein n=1 Tax=Helicobacter turcicus TaxID=2867412 RepID=A0ABS7JMB7_9HELI|nr:hypothetical protein [Helicobacter turcicus]MBX7490527.1 hypothetical protein [Helicobacter turcicus]MBX7545386.1 hypothetical protein [Helicobacter turcicus]